MNFTDQQIRAAFENSNVTIKRCIHCQKLYVERQLNSKFCSANCRVANHRFWQKRNLFKSTVKAKLEILPNFQSYTLQLGLKVDKQEQFEIGLNGTQKVFKGNVSEVYEQIENYLKAYKNGDLSEFYKKSKKEDIEQQIYEAEILSKM